MTDPAIVTIGYTKSPPTANDDSSTGNTPGTTVTQNILVNDHLSDGTPASTTNSTVSLINPGTGLPSANPNLVVVPGEGTWTYNPATGELSFTPQAGFTGTPTNIDYQLTENANGLTDNATVHVGYDICPTMTAGDDATICETAVPYTITGASAVNYVSVHWTTDGTGTFDDATKVNPKYTPSASDISDVQVVLTMTVTGTAACPVQTDQLVLTIWKQVTAFAGQDGSSCANTAYHVTDAHATNYTSVAWTISQGTGSLAGANTLAPIYTPGLNETGAVILTLTAQPIGTCPQATDQVTITYRACSIIANDDLSTGNLPGSNAVLNILANDKLFDGSTPLPSAVTVDLDPGTAGVQTTLAVPGQGTWSYNTTTGDLTFDPQPGFTGNPTPITYVLTETATGLSDNALVTVLYTELPPTAVDDHSTGNAPGANTIVSILANDKLSDGSQATTGNTTVALIDPATGHPSITPNVVVVPGQGTWSYDPSTGLLTFNPEPGFTG